MPEKVTPNKDLVQFSEAMTKFDIQEHVFDDLKEAEQIECKDTESRKILGKHRQSAKSLRKKIDDCRLEINRTHKAKTEKYAAALAGRVTGSIDVFDSKIKTFDKVRDERIAAKANIEKLRLGKIQWFMDGLEYDCSAGLEYNLSSDQIGLALDTLKRVEISAVGYQERTEGAEQKLANAIFMTESAYADRVDWEEQQAEAARIAKENAAKEKELADLEKERCRVKKIDDAIFSLKNEVSFGPGLSSHELKLFSEELGHKKLTESVYQDQLPDAHIILINAGKKAHDAWKVALSKEKELADAQAKFEDDRKVERERANKIALELAESNRIAREEIEAKEKALEKEKAEIAAKAIITERELVWEIAHQEAFEQDHKLALVMHGYYLLTKAKKYEATEKAKTEKAERVKLIEPDKTLISHVAKEIEQAIDNYILYEPLKTKEGQQLYLDLIAGLRVEIHKFKLAVKDLV